MISPIERAAEALVNAAFGQELPEAPIDLAKAVLSSIDTDELAQTLANHSYEVAYGGCPCGADFEGEPTLEDERSAYDHHIALAVKNWLTGKVIQQ